LSHGWSGEHWIANSSAISIPASRPAGDHRVEVPHVPSSGSSASCRPPPSRSPTSSRRHPAPPTPRCSSPCGSCARSGVPAADRTRVEAELRELRQHPRRHPRSAPRAREELVPCADSARARGRRRRRAARRPPRRGGRPPSPRGPASTVSFFLPSRSAPSARLAGQILLPAVDLPP